LPIAILLYSHRSLFEVIGILDGTPHLDGDYQAIFEVRGAEIGLFGVRRG
jgi:hypothetical protein